MADKVMTPGDVKLQAKENTMLGKPQCQEFIPGIERFSGFAGILISLIMVVLMFAVAVSLNYFFWSK